MPVVFYWGSALLGGVIGSFLNVCIYRLPAGLSLVSPGSRCPQCETPIRWYQNVPVLSWLILGGRCASCKTRISWRYPAVEVLTGLIFFLVFHRFGFAYETVVYWLFFSTLVVITFIDIDHQIIPNRISLPGIVVGFACTVGLLRAPWHDSILGIILGAGLLWSVATGYRLVTGVDGMGMGDVKLLAMIGAFLGWQSILPIVFLGSLAGSLVGVPLTLCQKKGRKLALPFGPFLSAGAFFYLFFWSSLFNWYIATFFAAP